MRRDRVSGKADTVYRIPRDGYAGATGLVLLAVGIAMPTSDSFFAAASVDPIRQKQHLLPHQNRHPSALIQYFPRCWIDKTKRGASRQAHDDSLS